MGFTEYLNGCDYIFLFNKCPVGHPFDLFIACVFSLKSDVSS